MRCDVFLMLLALLIIILVMMKNKVCFCQILYLRILVDLQHTSGTKNDVLAALGATINFTVLSEYVISLSVQVLYVY